MESKKNNWLLIVVSILCLLVGGVVGYFISNNFANKSEAINQENASNENTQNESNPTVEKNEQNQCKYEKLKDASQLTFDEKFEINEQAIPYNNVHVSGDFQSINEYMYSIKYPTGDWDIEGPDLYVIVWRENSKWKGSDTFYNMEELLQNLPNIDACK